MMDRKKLIKKYLEFFESKNHKIIPNTSLVPENDPTVLFISAGMHPLVPYLLGQKNPLGKRLCNVQKCIRTGDIEEVGDTFHHTFFEMLGNWSLGDYFKKKAIEYSFEFLTKVLKLPIKKLAVTVFAGDTNAPKDNEAAEIWKSLKIEKIIYMKNANWWGPAGNTGPCGPDTEMFYYKSKGKPVLDHRTFNENWIEIWNDVFMQYNKNSKGKFEPLKQKNVDTGMGVERTIAILNGLEDNYLAEMWKPIIEKIEKLSGKKYKRNEKTMRIIADHIKAAVFILAEGINPSNTEQGYVLRRLIRRAIFYGKKLEIPKEKDITTPLTKEIIKIYKDYPELKQNQKFIIDELNKEEDKFERTLEKGIKIAKQIASKKESFPKISNKDAFLLHQSHGLPIDVIKEVVSELGSDVDEKGFNKELQKHQELSRTASAGKFKSGLADNSEATTKLHTATHLLLAALRIVLKDKNIFQKGSNIIPERLRLDFSFPRKLTKKELKKIEDLVNAQIQNSCEVIREEMSPKKAKEKGALGVFDKKYGEKVSVYTIKNFSKEICAGPHIKNTCELGYFKIKKEESSSAGVRRIKAELLEQ